MQQSSARRFHAVLMRDQKAWQIEQALRAAQPHLSDDYIGEMNRKELDARGYSIDAILGMGENNPLTQYHDRASSAGWGLEPAKGD